MSATGRAADSGYVRDPDDFFETPRWCVDAILPHLPSGGRVLDPGCGTGAILRALMATPPFLHEQLYGVEVHEGRAEETRMIFANARKHHVETGNFLTMVGQPFDLIIGNPPFSEAMPFIEQALLLTRPFHGTVAMLLRMNWLGSQERSDFHRKNPCDLFCLPRRPSFCASLKCKPKTGKGCGWQVTQRVDDPRVKACPMCSSAISITTSDSTEYAWFVWGPGRGNRWYLLDTPASLTTEGKP